MRTTLHGVVARFGSRALPVVACSASSARVGSITSRVPVVSRPLRAILEMVSARGERPRSLRVGPREREDAPTTRDGSLPRTERLRARWLSPRRESRRRSLDDAREGAARCVIRSLPTSSDSSRCDCGSAPSRLVLVQLASDPPEGGSEPVAMAGVHPHTPLGRPPLAWELGPARELRATRVSCSTPRGAGSPCPLRCAEGSR